MSNNTHPNWPIFCSNGMPKVRSGRMGWMAGKTYCSVMTIISPIEPSVAAVFSMIYEMRILCQLSRGNIPVCPRIFQLINQSWTKHVIQKIGISQVIRIRDFLRHRPR